MQDMLDSDFTPIYLGSAVAKPEQLAREVLSAAKAQNLPMLVFLGTDNGVYAQPAAYVMTYAYCEIVGVYTKDVPFMDLIDDLVAVIEAKLNAIGIVAAAPRSHRSSGSDIPVHA